MNPEADDDERTVIRPISAQERSATKPNPSSEPQDHNALPLGTRIGEFEIRALVGVGGFGIVYLAHDHSLGRDVALKEYMPSSLAARPDGVTVSVKSQRHAETFAAGLRSFINEARLLAQFDSPSLVKVYRFWEANGTAYMVMPFYEGLTLKQALLEMKSPPGEEWLKRLLAPLIDALQLLHQQSCFHRDIAPDNILLLKDGRPVLLDFGAARKVIGDMDKALTVILKPGYAPIEQYADEPGMKQGAWTDIYALAAVIHYAIMGKPPTPSVGRLMNDTTVPLTKAATGRYSEGFQRGLDQALAVRPEDRPQDLGAFRNLIELEHHAREPAGIHQSDPPNISQTSPEKGRNKGVFIALGAVVAVATGLAAYFTMVREPLPVAGGSPSGSHSPGVSESVGKAPLEPAKVRPVPPEPPATPIAQANEPSVSVPSAPVSAGQGKAYDPIDALDQLYDRREVGRSVTVGLDKTEVKIGKGKLTFRVHSEKPGYLYILMVGTDKNHIYLLFPNALDQKNAVAAGREISLPRPGWTMTAGGPPGINHFVALVSDHPRDFSKIELTKAGAFSEFSAAKVESMLRSSSGDSAVLAGTPRCKSTEDCSSAYGAAKFSIAEVN
jgi:serine/threonine protein kinase